VKKVVSRFWQMQSMKCNQYSQHIRPNCQEQAKATFSLFLNARPCSSHSYHSHWRERQNPSLCAWTSLL